MSKETISLIISFTILFIALLISAIQLIATHRQLREISIKSDILKSKLDVMKIVNENYKSSSDAIVYVECFSLALIKHLIKNKILTNRDLKHINRLRDSLFSEYLEKLKETEECKNTNR